MMKMRKRCIGILLFMLNCLAMLLPIELLRKKPIRTSSIPWLPFNFKINLRMMICKDFTPFSGFVCILLNVLMLYLKPISSFLFSSVISLSLFFFFLLLFFIFPFQLSSVPFSFYILLFSLFLFLSFSIPLAYSSFLFLFFFVLIPFLILFIFVFLFLIYFLKIYKRFFLIRFLISFN